jgi:2-(1,2-epoxy-1,2-dihydrophenyl)acetyl-CoA isomerase
MSTIIYTVEDGVATIKFNRPDVLNSFNREMAFAFQKALDAAASDKEVRAVIITGEGRSFSAGQDLEEVTSGEKIHIKNIVKEHYNPIITRIRELELPVVAVVNGVAAGAGANIALACDIVIASEKASFIQAFSKIGLIPDSGGTFILPRLIGWGRASALMIMGDKVSANDALQMGMIYKVVDPDELLGHAREIAAKLSKMPTKGIAYTKQALNSSFNNTLVDQLNMEERLQSAAGSTYDYNEGVNAFLEKRKPEFKGE